MSQVIVHTNENGGVSVTYPTPEFLEKNTIEDVLAKDCPNHAIIIDESALPQGDDDQFFDAWELNGTTITVNITKAKAVKLSQYNAAVIFVAQKRQLNTLSGIENTPDDATWQAKLTADRAAIAAATTTAQLVAVANPTGA